MRWFSGTDGWSPSRGGWIAPLRERLLVDLSLVSDDLNLDELQRAPATRVRPRPRNRSHRVPSAALSRLEKFLSDHPVRGTVTVTTDRFTLFGHTWHPFQADVVFLDTGLEARITDARLCGIQTPGTVAIQGQNVLLDITVREEDQDVRPMITCLRKDQMLATGTYSLKGGITARGAVDTLVENLKGDLEYTAREGRIYRNIPLARLFAYLDIIEIFKQILPNLQKEGFAYRSMDIKGRLENGKLIITEGIIDSPVMEIAGRGDIHLKNRVYALDVLVAPMQTVNRLIKKVPVVNQIMGGTLFSFAVEIEGDWSDPVISPLPAGEVIEQSLIRLMKRTAEMPGKLLEPVFPGETGEKPAE